MKQKGSEISVFFISLLCVTVSVGLMRTVRKSSAMGTAYFSTLPDLQQNTDQQTPEAIMRSLQPLLVSRNVGMLAKLVSQCDPHMVCSLASMMVCGNQASMVHEDKLPFLLMLARENDKSRTVQFKIFDLMLSAHLFTNYSPAFLGAAKKDYMTVLPSLLAWMEHHKMEQQNGAHYTHPEAKRLIDEAFYSAVEQNDPGYLELLGAHGMRLDSQKASDLLVHVVYDRKKSSFIPFLIHRGADVNRIGPDRYTLLSKAVSYNDLATARTLLEAGADVQLQVDESIGSALQIARSGGNKELQKLCDAYVTRG
jgi:hypothetical protein